MGRALCILKSRFRVLSGLLAATTLGTFASGCADTSASQSSPAPALPQVVAARPVKMPIVEWDEFIGRLAAIESVEVRARVSGYLATSNFVEGQMVKAGDLLAVIDQRPFLMEVNRSRAALASAEAQLGEAQSSVVQSQAERRGRVIRAELAQKLYDRTSGLRERNAATQEELDVREAELAESLAEVIVGDSRIKAAEASVIAAEAAVGTAKANLELAQLNLQYTEVRAPITGLISRRHVTEGNLISGGTADSTLLTTIVSTDPIHCYFDADEQTFLKYMSLTREGKQPNARDVRNPVYLALANERNGFPRWGPMDFLENRFDEGTATIRGRAILPNPNGELAPGLFARVRIPGSPRHDAILIPDRAIGTDQAEKFVLVVDGGQIARRSVKLGPISHGLRVIREGLTGDELLVISGLQRAKPGTEVATTEEALTPGPESLPDEYEPVPEEKWLTPKRGAAANVQMPPQQLPESQLIKTSAVPVGGETLP